VTPSLPLKQHIFRSPPSIFPWQRAEANNKLHNTKQSPGHSARYYTEEGTEKMRPFILLGVLVLAGCSNTRVAGPLENNRNPVNVDDPRYSIPEQEMRARDHMSFPEFRPSVAPPSPSPPPGYRD
jgi:hypothetical protein